MHPAASCSIEITEIDLDLPRYSYDVFIDGLNCI